MFPVKHSGEKNYLACFFKIPLCSFSFPEILIQQVGAEAQDCAFWLITPEGLWCDFQDKRRETLQGSGNT